MPQQPHLFETETARLGYLLHLPPDYKEESGQKWPLILFLHGKGERGDDLQVVKKHGIARIAEEQPDFPFIAVSPQCPEESWWVQETEALKALLDFILAAYPVDRKRVYLTGLSMGGYGAWALGSAYPEMFAAVAPVCGGGDPDKVCALKDTPVWTFHGDEDEIVPFSETAKMVQALTACKGKVTLTIYKDVGHDSWTETYANPELYKWFLSHSL